MNFEFKLPDIGEGLVEGEIVKWFVKEGQAVQEHQPLAAVLTDKAEVEIPSPRSGKVVKLYGKPGEKVKVHGPFALIEVAGGGEAAPEAKPQKTAMRTTTSAPPAPQAPQARTAVAERPAEYVFNLPDIGEGLVDGELVRWHVKAGQTVQENEPVAAVLTDKAEVEIPSPRTGKVAVLHAKPGEKVKVHAPLVTFELAGGAAPKAAGAPASAPAAEAPRAAAAPRARTGRETDVPATPRVRKMAKDMGFDLADVLGTGPEGRVLESDLKAFKPGASAPAGGASVSAGNARANATAAVKALADSLGVDLTRVKGTGPGGRISEPDVRAAAPARPAAAAAPSASPAPAPSAGGYPPVSIPRQPGDETVPFSGIRRKIAERMVQSRRSVAHVTHMDECEMTAVLALRESMKQEAGKRGVKLTFLPFVIKALTKALQQHPAFNAALDEAAGEVVLRKRCNVGIAVAAPQGLVVPNVKGAEEKDVWALAAEIAALAEKVRANKIDVPSLQGGTVTITNIGPIGGLFATPIVNHPESAILGLMKLQDRPVARDGKVVVRSMMNLVLSFDHRIADGADAAQFMNTLIKHLENPRTLL